MTRMRCLLLALGLFAWSTLGLAEGIEVGPPEAPSPERPVLLRVATFNLHHGVSADGRTTLVEMAAFLRDNCVDLVGLQELDRNWSARSEFRDQAGELAAATGLKLCFMPTLTRGNEGSYGMAVLTRFPPADVRSGLYDQAAPEPRGYLTIQIEVAGKRISFAVTHLGLSAVDRQAQVNQLSTALDDLPGPLILVGDLNGAPGDLAVMALAANLRDALTAVGRGDQGTLVASGQGNSRIDYLFVSPEFRIEDALVPMIDLSDHRPVLAYLSLLVEERG